MIEDAPADGASDVEVPDADGDDNDDHLARWIEEELEQEEALVNSIQHVREPDEGEGDSGQDPARHAPLAEVVEGEGSGHVRHGHRRDLEILQWGVFDIALKVQSSGNTPWECRCPFHKLSSQTGCKRTIDFNDNSKDHGLIAAKWWCNQAQMHSRQKTH
jgi:hypothetical protein